MTGPRLALCIPARNAGAHLPRLLETVRAQTDAFDHVLLYDDASTDDTAGIAREFGAVVVRTDINTGPSTGKNVLAATTDCEWLHFHDADEALHPRFVEYARLWMTGHDVDVVLFGTEDCDDLTGRLLGSRRWDDSALRADAVGYCIRETITNCGIYRRAAFLGAGGFDTREETKYNEDQAMHLRLALAGLRFRADDYIADIIYRRANSMSSGHPIECARAHFHVLETAVQHTGSKYARDIGGELWRLAGVCGTYRDWVFVRRCLALADRIGFRGPAGDDPVFRAIARITPFGAIAAREQFVRWFKPQLRSGSPSV